MWPLTPKVSKKDYNQLLIDRDFYKKQAEDYRAISENLVADYKKLVQSYMTVSDNFKKLYKLCDDLMDTVV